MAKRVKAVVKMLLPAGKATMAPPVGPNLAPHQINTQMFVKQFNDRTAKNVGDTLPVVVTIFEDRSFTFVVKTAPAVALLKKASGIETASGQPNTKKIGKVTRDQVREIAQAKMRDLSAASVEAAMKTIEGTARSMGIEVVQ